jgi:hypothetical protein
VGGVDALAHRGDALRVADEAEGVGDEGAQAGVGGVLLAGLLLLVLLLFLLVGLLGDLGRRSRPAA